MARILNAYYAGRLRAAETDPWKLDKAELALAVNWIPPLEGPGAGMTAVEMRRLLGHRFFGYFVYWSGVRSQNAAHLARLRLARIHFARALYQSETGKPPDALQNLVPKYLPAIPVNPKTGEQFTLESAMRDPEKRNEPSE